MASQATETHDVDPPHDLCLGDDPCVCTQLLECEERAFATSLGALNRVTEERDRARAIAVALENEIHMCREGHYYHRNAAHG